MAKDYISFDRELTKITLSTRMPRVERVKVMILGLHKIKLICLVVSLFSLTAGAFNFGVIMNSDIIVLSYCSIIVHILQS